MSRMSGYTKLFQSILASTIWEADMPTRIVWITMLAMADKNGVVEGSVPGLATFARVKVADVRKALAALQSPDKDSRSQEQDGRRIEAIDGGWRLINHAKYRAKLNADERREYLRQKQREYRASTKVNNVSDTDTVLTQAEAEAEIIQDQDPVSPLARLTPADELRNAWNDLTTPPIPRCLALSYARRKLAVSRLRDRDLEDWRDCIRLIEDSDFCRGQNDRGWVATFDWLLRPDTRLRVMEGKYANRAGVAPKVSKGDKTTRALDALDEALAIDAARRKAVGAGRT